MIASWRSSADGLARALEDVAGTRQVIVFTHDERLPEAVLRLGIEATVLKVTRRPQSVVEIRPGINPVRAHIEDALALVHATDLPKDVLQRLVPGFCRAALEASFTQLVRRRGLAAGRSHSDIDDDLKNAGKTTPLAALALFGDRERGGDVMGRLNQFGFQVPGSTFQVLGSRFSVPGSGFHGKVAALAICCRGRTRELQASGHAPLLCVRQALETMLDDLWRKRAPGLRVPGSRFQVPGSRFQVRLKVLGSRFS